jgi:hypothetical protein
LARPFTIFSVFLNGQLIAKLGDGENVQVNTFLAENVLFVDSETVFAHMPLYFSVYPGTSALIAFTPYGFRLQDSQGITLLNDDQVKFLAQPSSGPPSAYAPPQPYGPPPPPPQQWPPMPPR